MTMNSITSDQRKQYNRFTQDGARKALTIVGPDKDGLQRLFGRGDEWQDYLIAGVARFTAKTPDYGLAQSILGADFITPEEVTKARPSVVYTDDQITALAESLPSEDMLKWCKDNGYAVIPAPPTAMSTLDVREIQSAHFYTKTGGWYANQKFAHEDKTSFGWLAIKKTPVSNSTSKNWNEQNKLLSALEKVPNAAEMSWFITTYFEVRGVRLFENVYVRTSSLDSDGRRVYVGYFGAGGLHVDLYWDDGRDGFLGLSAGRKF
jgi:hypothetical protein